MQMPVSGYAPLIVLSFGLIASVSAIEPNETFALWPGTPPGRSSAQGEEKKVEGRPRPFYQLTDISKPTVSVFLPPKERRLGTALLVLPGGGLQRLAYEHEGLEVAEWAVARGIAAFVVKYRVPAPAVTGTQDGQRALSLIRARAKEWDVDPESIGVIGFSAGGEIAAWMITHHNARQYETVDANDAFSSRPDFVAMIYPGGLTRSNTIKEPIGSKINRDSPPMFFVHASDDAAENSLVYAMALKQARVPVELHIYRDGAHGFGVRESGSPVGTWTARFEDWMRSLGYLDKPSVRSYVRDFSEALKGTGALPRFPENAALEDAFSAQKRLVRANLKDGTIGGFKGGVVTDEAQRNLGLSHPLTGVLFSSGRLNAADRPVIGLASAPDTMVETEIGYVIGENIATRILNDTQARESVQSIVPVIEIPQNYARRMGVSAMSAKDLVASNVGSARYIVGTAKNPAGVDANALKVSLKRDGQTLHETTGAFVKGGQWTNLRLLLNQLTAHGNTVRAGTIVICGALGGPKPGEPGKYRADYGELGFIEFELQK